MPYPSLLCPEPLSLRQTTADPYLHRRCSNTVLSQSLECKSRKSGKTWSNRKIWPWSTEWSKAKANRVLPREHTGHSKHPLPTTQEKILHMDITRWSTPKSDWLHSLQPKMEKLYTVSKNKTGRWLAQIMESLLPNSDLNRRKQGKTIQVLLQRYWSGHRLGLLWYWMVCLGNEQRSFCRFWDCIQVLHLGFFFFLMMVTTFLLRYSCPQ